MNENGPSDIDASRLSRMFEQAGSDKPVWHVDELGALWRHQLAAPIDAELAQFNGFSMPETNDWQQHSGGTIATFGQLLHDRCPPVALLEIVKQFAKSQRGREGLLPDEIATMLYILSIVAAASHAHRSISKMDDQALSHALDWAAGQSWIDPPSRELIAEGYRLISSRSNKESP